MTREVIGRDMTAILLVSLHPEIMTNPHYHIKSSETLSGDSAPDISIQIDTNGLTVLHLANNVPVELQYYRIEAATGEQYFSELRELLSEVAKGAVKTVLLNTPESSLMPEELYSPEAAEEITNLLHGDLRKGKISTDHIPQWKVQNIYRLPAELHDMLQQLMPQAEIKHFNSLWLGCLSQNSGNSLHLVIHPSHFLATVIKESKLQIIQRFVYESDEDLLFFLLSLCRELSLDPATLAVSVSGFILEDSSLYASLIRAFPAIEFWKLTSSINTASQFPQHFFSPILNLPKCVS